LPGGSGSGGGIWGAATISNSTIANNTAAGGQGALDCSSAGGNGTGGGLEPSGPVTLVNTTVAGNVTHGGSGTNGAPAGTGTGGGIHVSASASATNTVIAANSATTAGPDCDGTVTSGGHNLISNDSSCSGFTGPGDQVNVDPILGRLQSNGGPTQTMAISVGSPAQDHGDALACAAAPVNGIDQRGVARQYDPSCDIGAYEQTG